MRRKAPKTQLKCVCVWCVFRRVPVSCQPIDDDDADVACERRRVLRGDADNDMLKIENLTKVLLDDVFSTRIY